MSTPTASLDRLPHTPPPLVHRPRERSRRLLPVLEPSFVLELSDRLAVEYAGAVAPGRILACVVLTKHRLRAVDLDERTRRDLIEATVRRELVRTSVRPHDPAPAVATPTRRAG